MTVSSTAALSGPYTGTGATVAFPFTFKALTTAEVSVLVDGSEISSSLYSVALTDSGGTVTFTTAPASNAVIFIVSSPSFLQDIDLQDNGAYSAAAFDEAHDRAAVRDLALKRDVARSLKVAMGETAPDAVSFADADGKLLAVIAGQIVPIDSDVASAIDSATTAAADAAAAHVDRLAADDDAATAQIAAAEASATSAAAGLYAAAAEALTAGYLFATAAEGVSQGILSLTIATAGSAGANGTFPLAFSGGGGSGAAGTFTVAGGAVTAVSLTSRGKNYSSNPTVSLAASAGLTSASVTAARGNYAVPDGAYFLVSGSGNTFATLYKNVAGTATAQGLEIASMALVQQMTALVQTVATDLLSYDGTDAIQPLIVDEDYGLVLGYDTDSATMVGPMTGASAGTAEPIDLPAGSVPDLTGIVRAGVVTHGQSNDTGTNATPVLSTSQPFSNIMFTGGVRKKGPSFGGTLSSTAALIENTATGADAADNPTVGETMCSGVNYATQLRLIRDGGGASDLKWHPSASGWTSQVIELLRKGQTRYSAISDHITAIAALASGAGQPLAFVANAIVQGESNAIATDLSGNSNTRATYLAQMLAHLAEVRADMKAASGQSWNPHSLLFQVPYGTLTGTHPGGIQLGQFDAVNQDSLCHFVAPLYFMLTGGDATHYTNVSQKRMGLYLGRALYQLVHEQRVPDCLWPLSATAKARRVTLLMRTPTFPLQLDSVNLFAATDYGMKLVDDTGTLTLTNWAVSGDRVSVTVHRDLGANPKWRCGLDYAGTGQSGIGYACANLRDSTADAVTIDGAPFTLWHAAPQFELPIQVLDPNL